jgi:hypothetical protein
MAAALPLAAMTSTTSATAVRKVSRCLAAVLAPAPVLSSRPCPCVQPQKRAALPSVPLTPLPLHRCPHCCNAQQWTAFVAGEFEIAAGIQPWKREQRLTEMYVLISAIYTAAAAELQTAANDTISATADLAEAVAAEDDDDEDDL